MADDKIVRAQDTFDTLCTALAENEWNYKKNEIELEIDCTAVGDDFPMDVNITVEADRQLIILISPLPFITPPEKRLDVAVAVTLVNNMLADGCFDYNIKSGRMFFRMTNSFMESDMSKDVFTYLLNVSFATVDMYNDKFYMLGKGMLSIDAFYPDNQ